MPTETDVNAVTYALKDGLVQVQPQQAQIILNTAEGAELELEPGRQVVARVVDSSGDGRSARISLAGTIITVNTAQPLTAGSEIKLSISQADDAAIKFELILDNEQDPEATTKPAQSTHQSQLSRTPAATGASTSAIMGELARAGAKISPALIKEVARVVAQLNQDTSVTTRPTLGNSSIPIANNEIGNNPAGSNPVGSSLRASALLAARNIELTGSSVQRVMVVLESAGKANQILQNLASKESIIADALPSKPPTDLALRTLLSPQLQPVELAVARISIALSSREAALSHGASLKTAQDSLPSQLFVPAKGELVDNLLSRNTQASAAVSSARTGIDSALSLTASLQRSAGLSLPSPIPPSAAQSQLSPAQSIPSAETPAQSHPVSSSRLIHAAIDLVQTLSGNDLREKGEATKALSNTDPKPLTTNDAREQIRALISLSSKADETQIERSLQTILRGASASTLRHALQNLSETQILQFVGLALERVKGSATGREIQQALQQIGQALSNAVDDSEMIQLKSALLEVATRNGKLNTGNDALKLLNVMDGQQLISRSTNSTDTGYVYFNVPLPQGRGAEVIIRREPGQRKITFENFDIAFLLDTEHLGNLLIHLQAQPHGVHASIKTDQPDAEKFLRDQSEDLVEALLRESKRKVNLTVGTYITAPSTLLASDVTPLKKGAGEHEYYV